MRIIILLLMTLSLYAAYVQKGTTQYPVTIEGQEGHEYYRGYSLDYGIFASSHEFNPKKGIELLKIAVSKNDVLAMYDMYMIYKDGIYGEDINKEKANELLKKSINGIEALSKYGNIRATALLGVIYQNGLGKFKINKQEALNLYVKAAKEGSPLAIYFKAACYRYDDFCGEKKDSEKSIGYYKDASDKGLIVSTRDLGLMYFGAKNGLKFNEEKMLDFLQKSDGDYISLRYLGHYYEWKKEYKKAFEYFTKSAKLGENYSYLKLAKNWYLEDKYDMGTKDLKKAKLYFLEAKKRGINKADSFLAQLRTPTEKFYHKLIDYEGMQTKEKVSLVNKEPITANPPSIQFSDFKHKYINNIKISDNSRYVIIENQLYDVAVKKIIHTFKEKSMNVLDFVGNKHIYISTKKWHGIYSILNKKIEFKKEHKHQFPRIVYSNGISRIKYPNKDAIFYDVTASNIKQNTKYKSSSYGENYPEFTVNDEHTFAVYNYKTYPYTRAYKTKKSYLWDIKNNSRKNSILKAECYRYRFVTNSIFQCNGDLYKMPNFKKINLKEGLGFKIALSNNKQYVGLMSDTLILSDLETFKEVDRIKLDKESYYISTKLSKDDHILVGQESSDSNKFNIFNIVNFAGNTQSKIINQTWIEVDKLLKDDSKIKKQKLLQDALGIAYSQYTIKIDSATFKQKENTVEVSLNNLGTYTFKTKDKIKSLSDTYILKNEKFKILNNNIELISADLYPSDYGYILSYGRVPPAYKLSNKNTKKLFKFNKKEEKKFKKIQKMLKADFQEEATILLDSLITTNPIGLYWRGDELNDKSWPIDGKIWIASKNAFLNLKIAHLGINTYDTKNSREIGAAIKSIDENSPMEKAGAEIGDIILSVNGYDIIRKNDLNEILNTLEEDNIEMVILRNDFKIKLNVSPKYIVKHAESLIYSYQKYLRNSIQSGHPSLAKIAYNELEENVNNGNILPLNKYGKEFMLVLKAMILSANGNEKEGFKILLNYDDEFEKGIKDLVLDGDYWYDLLKYPKKLAAVFDIDPDDIKKVKKYFKEDYVDLDGNIVKYGDAKQQVKKKLKLNSQKGGVLE